ncbi:PREDICTED: uncharacterized protein LOC106812184 [Priapulus caudatus]|uniref:Uncharacterized protein LOC106812184 n=1 Tax=Priapulus caudatus TaxID=37621 RepID=A0ABM1EH21_PRICU|nr:PREDICTED: uncharacterized protein LOC106812184 [Priapulus caudatus]
MFSLCFVVNDESCDNFKCGQSPDWRTRRIITFSMQRRATIEWLPVSSSTYKEVHRDILPITSRKDTENRHVFEATSCTARLIFNVIILEKMREGRERETARDEGEREGERTTERLPGSNQRWSGVAMETTWLPSMLVWRLQGNHQARPLGLLAQRLHGDRQAAVVTETTRTQTLLEATA